MRRIGVAATTLAADLPEAAQRRWDNVHGQTQNTKGNEKGPRLLWALRPCWNPVRLAPPWG